VLPPNTFPSSDDIDLSAYCKRKRRRGILRCATCRYGKIYMTENDCCGTCRPEYVDLGLPRFPNGPITLRPVEQPGHWPGHNFFDEDDESVGLGFAGSTFRHAVNNQRPEVQRANRRGFINGMKATFKNPGDIPTSKSSAAQKGFELGVNMHKHGYGSQGMGNWDEMDEDDESVGWGDERPSHTRAHRPTGKSVNDWINFRL
jgi:hypothetical protein